MPAAPLAGVCARNILTKSSDNLIYWAGRPLRLAFQSGSVRSCGSAGVGKTTGAADGAAFDAEFVPLSAVLSGVKDIREAISQAQQVLQQRGRNTILFVDEVHRFNKSQQDAFLPFV